eukprot:302244-Pyramimonas_sp.AAC.1
MTSSLGAGSGVGRPLPPLCPPGAAASVAGSPQPSRRAEPDARQRDIFPLPYLGRRHEGASFGRSRRGRHRAPDDALWHDWANDAVDVMNAVCAPGAQPSSLGLAE